jgi:actin-like ATPase involved in cell morphogenesis
MGYNLGVDLGTTFVAAAISRDGHAQMCTLGNQTVVTPSVVYLSEGSALIFGEAAERRALSQPDRVEREFKRRLGDPTPVVLGGVPYQVTTLMGALLRDVLGKVTTVEGGPPDRVALTYPANWGPYRRELFDEVPQLAGLSSHIALSEPEAAAAYYATSRYLDEGDIIAVYDLGGGTFDATVLRKHNGMVDLVGEPEGIERLGGIDFDEAIIQWINYNHGGALAELDMADPQAAAAIAKLRQECVQAKEALSSDTETMIPVLLPNRHFSVRLTRRDFEGMVRAPIESTIGTLVRAVRNAHLDVDQLSAVLLVGGSSRIPLVERMIAEELGRPTVVDAHPKYSVALGAAMVAAHQSASAGARSTAAARHVIDVMPAAAPSAAASRDPAPGVDAVDRPSSDPTGPPGTPVFPSASSGGSPGDDGRMARRRRRIGTTAAIAALVIALTAVVYLTFRNPSPGSAAPSGTPSPTSGTTRPRTSPSHSPASPSTTTSPPVTGASALLSCPRSLKEYGCITSAVFNGKTLVARYEAVGFTPTDPNTRSGHHLHLFTANIEYGGALEPPDSSMQMVGGRPGGNWWTEFNPPAFSIGVNDVAAGVSSLGQPLRTTDKYLCIRVATWNHMLIPGKKEFDTGNCFPISIKR